MIEGLEALLREYPVAAITHHHCTPADIQGQAVGHFGFFREHMRASLWLETVEWLRKR